MLKKSVYAAGGALLLMTLLFGRDACSYVSTTVGWMKDSVRESIPLEFEIERARKMLADLEPEIRRNMHLIAKEEVDLERLENQIDRLDEKLASDQSGLMQLKAHLDTGQDYFYHAGQRYSEQQVRADLSNRFERFKTGDQTLANLRKVQDARQRSLEAARQQLEGMLAAKRNLIVDVENLEARKKMVEVAQTASDFNFDDSRLARTKELITSIRTRIEVAEKMMDADLHFQEGIPLDQPSDEDIAEEIATYFDARDPSPATEAYADN
jgi:chromosome segregation ATPase